MKFISQHQCMTHKIMHQAESSRVIKILCRGYCLNDHHDYDDKECMKNSVESQYLDLGSEMVEKKTALSD